MLFLEDVFVIIMGSLDLEKIESDRDIRKTRDVSKNLRFCGKMKNCTQQLTSILKH